MWETTAMTAPMPCVWMSAGLVAYKLCDRDGDCENCPFDLAMRGASRERAEASEPHADTPKAGFPADRRYHRGHTWARRIEARHWRVGLDAFAATLLEPASGLVLPTVGTSVQAGAIAVWVWDGEALVPIRSPLSGRVLESNSALRDRPTLANQAPYDQGWLLEVRVPSDREAEAELLDAAGVGELAARQTLELQCATAEFVRNSRPSEIGPTLQDGGPLSEGARAILGGRRYRKLISTFLTG